MGQAPPFIRGAVVGFYQSSAHMNKSGNKLSQVGTVHNIGLRDTGYLPAMPGEVPVLPSVAVGVLMPIGAVNLQRDAARGQEKVDRIPAYGRFLYEVDLHAGQCGSDLGFERGFATEAPVAGERAETAVGGTGHVTERGSASLALDEVRWAAALLRAVVPVQVSLGYKRLTATFARLILGASRAAGIATEVVALGLRGKNREGLTALRAHLVDLWSRREFTSLAAIGHTRLHTARSHVELALALWADSIRASALPLRWPKLHVLPSCRHWQTPVTRIRNKYISCSLPMQGAP